MPGPNVRDEPPIREQSAVQFVASWETTESMRLLREVMGLGGHVRQAVSRTAGLSVSELHAVEHLYLQPMGPGEIARLLDVSTAAATGIVDRLEARGHAERRPNPTDRRRTDVTLTPSAKEEVLTHLLPMFQALALLDASFTPEERDVVVRYLRGAVDACAAVMDGPAPGSGRPSAGRSPGPPAG